MTPEPEIISWSVLFPTTWTPRNWPPQTLTDLTDIWVVITIGVALGMLFWAMIRTAQVWLKTRAYLCLASRLSSDGDALRDRSGWISNQSLPQTREFNALIFDDHPGDLIRSWCARNFRWSCHGHWRSRPELSKYQKLEPKYRPANSRLHHSLNHLVLWRF